MPDIGGTNRTHAEGQYVHDATLHAAAKKLLQPPPHNVWVFPIIGRPGAIARKRADERAVFNAGNIARHRASIEASGPALLIKTSKGSRINEALAEKVVLSLRTVNPVNGIGTAQLRHLLDPANQMFICRRWVFDGRTFGREYGRLHRVISPAFVIYRLTHAPVLYLSVDDISLHSKIVTFDDSCINTRCTLDWIGRFRLFSHLCDSQPIVFVRMIRDPGRQRHTEIAA